MAVAVRVSAAVTGHRHRGVREHDLVLQLAPGEVTARQLIGAAVTAEVVAFQARAEEASLVRVLTQESLAEGLAQGAIRPGWPRDREAVPDGKTMPGAQVDVAAAVDAALLAFADGIFKVFIGDDELTGDETARIADGKALLFLRLVPLAGG